MEPLSGRPPVAEAAFESRSPEQTAALGEALGRVIAPGHFVGLVGELGAGKTRFVRGLAQGAEVPPSEVASPTFAIVYPYRGRLLLHHADLYRLGSYDELYATGFEELQRSEGAMVVEWIDKIPGALPEDALVLTFELPDVTQETLRRLRARAYGPGSAALLDAWRGALSPAAR